MGLPFPKHFPWATFGRRETVAEFEGQWAAQCRRFALFPEKPLVSLVLPLPEAPAPRFPLCLAGVLHQSYANWELLVVTPRSPSAAADLPDDRRVRLVTAAGSHGERLDAGARAARGQWIGFVEPDSVPSPVALYQLLLEAEGGSLLHGNDVFLDDSARRIAGYLGRPELSLLNLLHFNYLGDFWLMRRETFGALGGFGALSREAAYHDLLLRFARREEKAVSHPAYLRYVFRSGVDPVGEAACQRVRIHAEALAPGARVALETHGGEPRIKVRPPLPEGEAPLVTAVIPFRDRAEWTLRSWEALDRQQGVSLEILLVDNDSSAGEREKVAARLGSTRHPARMLSHPGPFNFAHMNNAAVREHARGRFLLFLNNDVFLSGDGVVAEMARWAGLPRVGTVGIRLRYPHGAVQHEGIRGAFGGAARLVRVGHFPTEDRFTWESREVFANTFAACLVRREVHDAVGGLRELDLVNGFGDVAFNFECLKRGLRNFYLGHLEGVHLESASRGPAYEYWEEVTVERRYPELLQRMVRSDLAWNRVPGPDLSVRTAVKERILATVRERAPLLDPVKPHLKKWLRVLATRGHNQPA